MRERLRHRLAAPAVTLRPVGPSDLALLTRMAIAFNEEDGHPLSPSRRRALKVLCTGTPHGYAYLVERDHDPIGYIVIGLGYSVEYGGIDAFLDEFYIKDGHRKLGFGTTALGQLAKQARRMKIKALHLEAMPQNDGATRLYRRIGFRLSNRRLMSKRL